MLRKKERIHKTGKSNRRQYLKYLDDEYKNLKCYETENENNNDTNNHKINEIFTQSLSDDEHTYTKTGKDFFFKLNNKNERLKNFYVEKHEKKHNNNPIIELNKKTNDENYYKGIPCKFKKKTLVKQIDVNDLYNKKDINTKINKEYNFNEMWNYLNYINKSGDKIKRKVNEILNKKNIKNEEKKIYTDNKNNNNNNNELFSKKEETLKYEDYAEIIRYTLSYMNEDKIKKSWNVLTNNCQLKNEELDCNEFFNFLNKQSINKNDENSVKIIASKFQHEIQMNNYSPSDVNLKTINYIDNIRGKAFEFSKNFKEIITEKELYDVFNGIEKIKKKDLEQRISNIIKERINKENESLKENQINDNKNKINENKNEKEKIKLNKIKKEKLNDFNMKAYISTLLSNKDDEVSIEHFINNLKIDYDLLNRQNINIKDAYDFYTRGISPSENMDESYKNELNEEEIKRAKFLIEEIDDSIRNIKSLYINNEKNKSDKPSYLSLYEIFKNMDMDKDSYITEEDLNKCMNKLKIKSMQPNDVKILLKYMDNEKKGYVNINDFLEKYNIEEKSFRKCIRNVNQPYYKFIENLKQGNSHERCISENNNILINKNASHAKKYEDIIKNYNLELDPYCPSYVIRERIYKNFIAKKEDLLNKHLKATRFNITGYKNTNKLIEPIQNSALYMDDASRLKTTYNMNYN